jgi:ATP-binding cassette subfamily F protein 3
MILQLTNAKFAFPEREIFSDVNLQLNDNDRVGIVGYNGIGKSTLLKCIVGEMPLTEGAISTQNGTTIGYLKQNATLDSSLTVFDELMNVFAEDIQLEKDISDVTQAIAATPHDSALYHKLTSRYDNMLSAAAARDIYNVKVRVDTVINGMGLSTFRDSSIATLSGGEKTKVALCKLLLAKPTLMVLDEPTNHLDYKTLSWLESFLADAKSALLIVSHDRYFLDKLATKIWDFYQQTVIEYKGNYTAFKRQKAEMMKVQQRQHERDTELAEKLTDYIARNLERASTAKMALSRRKQLDKLDITAAPEKDRRPPSFEFQFSTESSLEALSVKNLTLSYGDRLILDKVSMDVEKGRKVALIGLNGTGKSSLMKIITSNDPKFFGKVLFGKNVRWGYYDQENLNLDSKLRVLDQLWFDNTSMSQTDVRGMLARAGLVGEDVFKTVGQLSGGERAKLGLCMLMTKDNNLLLLDEPTNHLDLLSREALEDALKAYEGTLLFVSHDRYFVNAIADTVVELDNKVLCSYEGNFDAFEATKKKLAAGVAVPQKVEVKKTVPDSGYRTAKQRAEDANRRTRVKELEALLKNLEADEHNLLYEMTLPEVAGDYLTLQKTANYLDIVKKKYEEAFLEWSALVGNTD